jgi:lysozyme
MPVTRREVFETFRPWLDGQGYASPGRIAAVNGLCDRLGLAANDNGDDAAAAPAAAPATLTSTTYDRAAMLEELVRDEGERLKVYRCTAGKLTIGVGRNLDDVGIFAHETAALGITKGSCARDGITKEQSRFLLNSDVDRVDRDLDRHLPWWRKLDPVRQRIMVNMAFNLGIGGLCGFKNTLAMIQGGNYASAAAGMMQSKWARQVGPRASRLSAMMKDGRA